MSTYTFDQEKLKNSTYDDDDEVLCVWWKSDETEARQHPYLVRGFVLVVGADHERLRTLSASSTQIRSDRIDNVKTSYEKEKGERNDES